MGGQLVLTSGRLLRLLAMAGLLAQEASMPESVPQLHSTWRHRAGRAATDRLIRAKTEGENRDDKNRAGALGKSRGLPILGK